MRSLWFDKFAGQQIWSAKRPCVAGQGTGSTAASPSLSANIKKPKNGFLYLKMVRGGFEFIKVK